MGTTSLREFLKSLCCSSRWNYAVFWKLQHQSQMFLTWDDGYYDIPKQEHSMKYALDNNLVEGLLKKSSSIYESSSYDGTVGGDTVGAAVTYMSNVQYPLGNGVVGKVASTGNYCWVFSGDILSGDFNSKLVPEYPNEWTYQFAAGIKTVLLVPVAPHGVLQLGSLESVVEDVGMVALIKEKFVIYQNFVGNSESVALNGEFLAPSSSLLMSALVGNLDNLSALSIGLVKSEDPFTSTANNIRTHLAIHEEPELLSQRPNFSGFGMTESELPDFSYPNNSSMGIFGEYSGSTMKSDRLTDQEFANNNLDATYHRDFGPSLNFPIDCELHKALAPGYMENVNDYSWDSSNGGKDVYCPSIYFSDGDLFSAAEGTEDKGRIFNSVDKKGILEPYVAQTHLDFKSSGKSFGQDSSTTSSGQFSGSIKRHNISEKSALSGENTHPQSHPTTTFRNPTVSSSPVSSSYGSMMSDLIETEQKNNYGYSNAKNISKVSGASKRKGNSGDNKKPRPRDRQLIQDRLKELRDLVPNGSKCSIDGLLERTVAHMMFLKSVSERADKLNRWEHKEGVNRKKKKSPEQNGGRQTGTSWAFELGSDQEVSPIIVEDLECPGHMLIEMICDENDRFLEIAEVIHGLNLSILKGVMEKRLDNTWAHFLIEAPRGLHRLDIFWPLMKLLQQNQSPVSSKI